MRNFLVISLLVVPSLLFAQYCASGGQSGNVSGSELITQVLIGTNLTPYSISCTGYTDHTNLSLNSFQSGSNIPFIIYTNKCAGWTGGFSFKACKIFIDWNSDGDFYDTGEIVYTSFQTSNWTQTFVASITVPSNIQCTQVRARIVYTRLGSSSTSWPNTAAIGPCGLYGYGETEDFIIPIDPCNDFDIDAGMDQLICLEDTITLNPEVIQGGVYQWLPNMYISNTNIANPEVYPLVTTTYTLTVDSAAGYIATDSVTIYVYPNPIIAVSQDQTVCHGGTPSDITVTNIPGAIYSWTPSNLLSNSLSNQTGFNSGLTNTTTYVITVELASCVSEDSLQITVNPVPTVNLSAIPNPACLGDDILLLANASIPVLRYRFQYNTNNWQNITTSNQSGWGSVNPIIYNNITTTTQFRVRVREDWGCTTSPWSPILTVPVINVTPTPIIHN